MLYRKYLDRIYGVQYNGYVSNEYVIKVMFLVLFRINLCLNREDNECDIQFCKIIK